MNSQPTPARRGETSSDKTLSVMDLFTPERPEWTVEEACAALGQSESTVYRYFRSLAAVGLILSVRPGRYLLGPGIVHYDRQLRLSDPLLRAAEPSMRDLAQRIPQPGRIFISRVHRASVMAVHELRTGSRPLPDGSFERGQLAALSDGAPALAILAFLEVRTARGMIQSAGTDAPDWTDLKRRMRAVRANGYATSIDGPDAGTMLVSVPLTREDGGVAGSLSLAFENPGDDGPTIARLATMLIAAAGQMAQLAAAQAPR